MKWSPDKILLTHPDSLPFTVPTRKSIKLYHFIQWTLSSIPIQSHLHCYLQTFSIFQYHRSRRTWTEFPESCANRFIPPTKSKLASKDVLQISLSLKRGPQTMKLILDRLRLWSPCVRCWSQDRVQVVGGGALVGPTNTNGWYVSVTHNNISLRHRTTELGFRFVEQNCKNVHSIYNRNFDQNICSCVLSPSQ
jgi:hypothetical protein